METMTITKCIHVTQTERKHLKAFLSSGRTSAKVNTKYYEVLQGRTLSEDVFEYQIRISTKIMGDSKYEHQTITLTHDKINK